MPAVQETWHRSRENGDSGQWVGPVGDRGQTACLLSFPLILHCLLPCRYRHVYLRGCSGKMPCLHYLLLSSPIFIYLMTLLCSWLLSCFSYYNILLFLPTM